jgi:hypothetical protein
VRRPFVGLAAAGLTELCEQRPRAQDRGCDPTANVAHHSEHLAVHLTGEKEIADRGSSCARRPFEATQLLDEAAGGPVSTRAITERAGGRAPTLYHHFGSKQALLDAVVSHGFKEFLRSRGAGSEDNDALEDVRAGWDSHVAFGLEFPGAYAHIYGNVKPGVLCRVTEDARAHLLEALEPKRPRESWPPAPASP